MLKRRITVRTLPDEQKNAYLSVLFLAILFLILLLRFALIGFANEGYIFHWLVVVFTILIGLFIQNYIAPASRMSSVGFRALGLLFFGIAMAIKAWALATNPLFILSIFLMTVQRNYLVTW